MMRFLRENAELITSICVVLSLLLGGALLYLKNRADTPPEIPVTAVTVPAPAPAPAPVAEPAAPPVNETK